MNRQRISGGFVTVTFDTGETIRARLQSIKTHTDDMTFTDHYGHEHRATRGPARFTIEAIASMEDEIRPPLPSRPPSPPEPPEPENPAWGTWS